MHHAAPLRKKSALYLLLLSLLLTACGSGRDPAVEQTIVAEHGTLSTQIQFERQTATFAADQIRVTAEYFGTEARAAQIRSTSLVSTLNALGVDTSGAGQITPVILTPTLRPGEQVSSGTVGGVTRIAPTPEARESTPTRQPSPTSLNPVIDPTLPNLTNVSVAAAVGNNDCATDVRPEYDIDTSLLYVVGTANLFTAGTTVTFTWSQAGQTVFTTDWTWNDPIDGVCIWYGFTPDDFPFNPGSYTVDFSIGGAIAAPSATFNLVDPDAAQEAGD